MMSSERRFIALLVAAFLVRLSLAKYGIHPGDFNSWVAWGERLWLGGFANFYESMWSDRLPGGILYLLWFLAGLREVFPFLANEIIYKLPANIADTVIAYLLFKFGERQWGFNRGVVVGLLYAFNPITWHVSALWGQMDSVQTLLLILVVWLLVRGYCVKSSVLLAYAFLFKPHSIVIVPLLVIFVWINRESSLAFIKKMAAMAGASLAMIWFSSFPFAQSNILLGRPMTIVVEPLRLVLERFYFALDVYPYTSLHAFNLWMVLDKNWVPDSMLFVGVSYHLWGMILFGVLVLAVTLILLKRRNQSLAVYSLAAAGLSLSAFTFLTRAHDKHVFPFFALFLFSLFTRRVAHRLVVYVLMSAGALANTIYSYNYQYGAGPPVGAFTAGLLSLIPVLVVYFVLYELLADVLAKGDDKAVL